MGRTWQTAVKTPVPCPRAYRPTAIKRAHVSATIPVRFGVRIVSGGIFHVSNTAHRQSTSHVVTERFGLEVITDDRRSLDLVLPLPWEWRIALSKAIPCELVGVQRHLVL